MLYFLIYLFLEVLVSVQISSAIGGLATFFEIVLSAVMGIAILMNFRNNLVANLRAVSYNCIDLEQFQKLELFTLIGALLLIVPGFLTDILGILLQFSVFTSMIVNYYNVKSGKCNSSFEEQNHNKKDSDVIDVEIIDNNNIGRE